MIISLRGHIQIATEEKRLPLFWKQKGYNFRKILAQIDPCRNKDENWKDTFCLYKKYAHKNLIKDILLQTIFGPYKIV